MKYLFDTDSLNFLYNPESGFREAFAQKLAELPIETELQISVLSLYELEYSCSNAPENKKDVIKETIQSIEKQFEVVPLKRKFATHYGEIKTLLKKFKNISPGTMKKYNIDLMIASSAIGEDSVLVSNDGAYQSLSELYPDFKIENWTLEI